LRLDIALTVQQPRPQQTRKIGPMATGVTG